MEDNRGNDGRFTPKQTAEDILEAVDTHEPAATSEVASELGVTRQSVDYRLRKMRDEGVVLSKKIGASLVWYLPDDLSIQPIDEELDHDQEEIVDELDEERRDGLDEVDFPKGKDRDRCEAAVYAARDLLVEEGPSTMREIVAEVMPEYPLGYDVGAALTSIEAGDRYRGAWWRRVVKPGLEALDDVEKPPRGASRWEIRDP